MASPDLVWMVRRRETRGASAGAARARRGGGGRGGGGDGARANASFYFCLLSRAAARASGYASGVPAAAPPGGCGGVPSSGDVTLGSRDQSRRLARPAKLRAVRVAPAGALALREKCLARSLHCRRPPQASGLRRTARPRRPVPGPECDAHVLAPARRTVLSNVADGVADCARVGCAAASAGECVADCSAGRRCASGGRAGG